MSEEQNKKKQLPDTSSRLPVTGNLEPTPIEPPQTKDMEVHHHGHVHHQKKWKEYLFEFLMLFLAVTAGFFVENQREHYIEHNREKQFIKKRTIDRFINQLFQYSMTNTWFMGNLKNWATIKAVQLDSLIKEEYHLR